MTRLTRPISLLSRAGALAVAATLALATPAGAATTSAVAFDCQATPPIGATQQLTLDSTIQADAPANVAAGSTFEITLAADPMTVPAAAGGYTVTSVKNLALRIPVPAGATYQSATLSDGSGLGDGTPTVAEADNVVTVTVPGPIAGGATFQLPVLHLTVTASGDPATTVESKLGGTSYTDAGLTFTATVNAVLFSIDVPVSCFPNPSPALTTTTIDPAESA